MDKEFNLVAVIRIILKWKKPLIIITLVAAVIAAFVSFFIMDEYYLSWSTFYPVNQYVYDRSMIFNSETTGGQISYFGGKDDINRIITIANSEPVFNYIIDSFKLVEHYKIDTTKKYWRTKAYKEFDKNYEAIKTEKDAVQISIYDTDPKLASAMVNAVVARVDELNKQEVNQTKINLYNVLSQQIGDQQTQVNEYVDTLAKLASMYKIKISLAGGNQLLVAGSELKDLVQGSNFEAVQQYKALLEKQENAMKELNNRENIKEQMEVALKSNASSIFIVEKAIPADKKDKPVRWLVILITAMVTLFVSVIGVLLIEQFNEIKKQL